MFYKLPDTSALHLLHELKLTSKSDKEFEWNWTKKSSKGYVASFYIDKKDTPATVVVSIDKAKDLDTAWEASFLIDGESPAKEGTGNNNFKVVKIVVEIIQKFVKINKPDILNINSKGEPLYSRVSRKLATSIGSSYLEVSYKSKESFFIKKNVFK